MPGELILPRDLTKQRDNQKEQLCELWRKRGLPGTVGFLHPLGGEMEVMLDHEARVVAERLRLDVVFDEVAKALP